MKRLIALMSILMLSLAFVGEAVARGGGGGGRSGGGGGGSRSSGGSSSRSSGGGGGKVTSGGKSYTPSRPSANRPSSGPRANPSVSKLVPPVAAGYAAGRLGSRPTGRNANGQNRPIPRRALPPRGRNVYRDQQFLKTRGYSQGFLDPYNRRYYGYRSSPFWYLYWYDLWYYDCSPQDQGSDPNCPLPPQRVSEGDGGCNSMAFPFWLFFGGGGMLLWAKRRKFKARVKRVGDRLRDIHSPIPEGV